MPFWHRLIIAAVVFAVITLLARVVDGLLSRRQLAPEAVTRYRVLRRTVTVSILVVGFFSALLVIPQVRAIAGGLLASSAVLGVIIGFASQRTLGNFVAGLLIAITQPVRLGDRVLWRNPFGDARLSDDELAVATALRAMRRFVTEGVPFYGIADAAEDQYLSELVHEAARTGRLMRSGDRAWGALPSLLTTTTAAGAGGGA